MTTQQNSTGLNGFVAKFLPWILAAAGLFVYLTTLDHWLSSNNFRHASMLMKEIPAMDFDAPLYYAVTYPFRWLPPGLIPLSLNVLSAVCMSLTLGLLARSVVLLPHDRTHNQRLREENDFSIFSGREAWLPPLLSVLVLGLQLTFWEGAITGMKELLDLLIFAYIIRCVLEYRVSERDAWLYQAALAYGLGMSENWLLIALLSAFLGALIWIRGLSFFKLQFLRWFILLGAAGLLLYLLMPVVFILSDHTNGTFWQAFKVNLKTQKQFLMELTVLRGNVLFLLSITSLLPLLLIGIKWASHFGDPSPMGIALTTGVFHLSHLLLLGASVWAAFDPAFGPRAIHIVPDRPALIILRPMYVVILSYLSALSIGYFAGYFLLVFRPLNERRRQLPVWKTLLHRLSQAFIWLLLLLVPAGLIYKNLPRIQMTNGPTLSRFAEQSARNLPDNAVVLSDDPLRLLLVKIWLVRSGQIKDHIFIPTPNLSSPLYFNEKSKAYGEDQLPAVDTKKIVDGRTQVTLLEKLAEKRPLYYLQPSFGAYFENYYPVPQGLVFKLERFETNSVSVPPPTEEQIASNEAFWNSNEAFLNGLLPFISEPAHGRKPTFREWFYQKLHIPFEVGRAASMAADYYSVVLNTWGVQLQIAGKLPEAARRFEMCLKLNPQNQPAQINLDLNSTLQAGVTPTIQPLQSVAGDDPNAIQKTLSEYGPCDDPTYRLLLGVLMRKGQLNRQSAIQFERIVALTPGYLPAKLWLAQTYVFNKMPDKALALVPGIRQQLEDSAEPLFSKYEVLRVELDALFTIGRGAEAEQRIKDELSRNPTNAPLINLAFSVAGEHGAYRSALHVVELALKMKPEDLGGLVNKGFLHMQLGEYAKAIETLSTALSIDPDNPTAKLNRAIAYLRNNQLTEARQDYTDLEKAGANSYQIYYGLGEIAWQQKDTNNAAKYYYQYLTTAPADTDEAKTVSDRYESLKTTAAP
ncbi:MAG: tetratricopeptide repeat protein [Verrucomicrobiota bacterium]